MSSSSTSRKIRVRSVSGDFHLSPLCGGIKGQISAGLMGPSSGVMAANAVKPKPCKKDEYSCFISILHIGISKFIF